MSDVIFARPRWNYESYADLYRLIELSGYQMVYFDEMDPASDNVYIMTIVNGENNQGWQSPRARIILWDLEWRLDGEYPRIPGVREVWASDRWYAETISAKFVPLGSHVRLPPEPLQDCPKVYDVSLLSYMTYRRMHIAHLMKEAGLTLAPQGWGMVRHEALQQTRLFVAVHQLDNVSTIAPQRWAIAAAYKLPVICENVQDGGVFTGRHARFVDYWSIPGTAKALRDHEAAREFGEALHDLLCVANNFRTFVEAAL